MSNKKIKTIQFPASTKKSTTKTLTLKIYRPDGHFIEVDILEKNFTFFLNRFFGTIFKAS